MYFNIILLYLIAIYIHTHYYPISKSLDTGPESYALNYSLTDKESLQKQLSKLASKKSIK